MTNEPSTDEPTENDTPEGEEDAPYIVQLGAGTRDAPSGVNLDVSGTVGPDHLGQETVDVDGHWADKPGVRSRLPESTSHHPRMSRMDTGEELPVLLSSNMRADPTEGVQGSYSTITEGECPRCGYDRLKVDVATLPGEHQESCMACGATINARFENGYRMPETSEGRARREKESGERIADLTSRGVYDLEATTGIGPYVAVVGERDITRLRKDDVETMFWALVDNDDIDAADSVHENAKLLDRLALALALIPDDAAIVPAGDVVDDDEQSGGTETTTDK